jgi:aminoglycoside phosphotransferase (APT) family kinase protein
VVGRNTTTVAAGAEGLVLVKRFDGADAERRYRNSLTWDGLQRRRELGIAPPVLEQREGERTLVFPYVQDAVSLQTYLDAGDEEPVSVHLLARCGRLLAQVHSLDLPPVLGPGQGAHLPTPWAQSDGPLAKFRYLTPDQFAAASGGELECWRLFHHDRELQDALMVWLASAAADPAPVPIHGDLRPDQFLVAPEGVFIVDWEEFTLGPATRDLAGVAGALIFDALVRTFGGDLGGFRTAADVHRTLLSRGQALLTAAQPGLRAFLNAYEGQSGLQADRRRLAVDIGWFLIERVLARSMLAHRLSASDRAIAGIGREAMTRPESLSGLLHDEGTDR